MMGDKTNKPNNPGNTNAPIANQKPTMGDTYDARTRQSRILANQNVEPRAKVHENPFAHLGTKKPHEPEDEPIAQNHDDSTHSLFAHKSNTENTIRMNRDQNAPFDTTGSRNQSDFSRAYNTMSLDDTDGMDQEDASKEQKRTAKTARPKTPSKIKKTLRVFIPLTLVIAVFASVVLYTLFQTVPPSPLPLTQAEQTAYDDVLSFNYGEPLTRKLPYGVTEAKLFLYAKSGIILDFATGCVLFEKNADALIPPASLTKIAVMYEVFDAIKNGETTLDTVVELVPQSWARNAPPQSSLMGLEKGQIVTVHELLMGLSVASGNDAATAIAFHLEDSVEAFCDRLNNTMKRLGLVNTHFVDTSGYSELNMTTPREFAALARAYIALYPDALQTYHSAPRFDFPTRANYPKNYTGDVKTRYIYATNKLLNQIEGCDGLKTGFIYESGYNIALTAKRGNTRFISVTMGGPGIGTAEGNKYRIADGKTLLNWAFTTFETYPSREGIAVPLKVWQGNGNALFAREAQPHAITVPKITEDAAANVVRTVHTADTLIAPINTGDVLGSVRYTLNGILLEEVPLIADRCIEEANVFKRIADKIAFRLIEKFEL